MNDTDLARLFRALHMREPAPDEETRKKAIRRLVFSEDGLMLIKHFSASHKQVVNRSNGVSLEFMEGRRSVLLEMIKIATREGGEYGRE